MKLKNILSILFFLVVAASCSMESDTVMNDISNENIPTGTEKNAYLSFNLNMGEAQTKASTSIEGDLETEEAKIKNVIFFLLDNNGNVLNYATAVNDTMLTKVKTGLRVMAVANTSEEVQSRLLACSNKTEINEVTLSNTDLTKLPKVGEAAVGFVGNEGTSSTKDCPTKEVTVTVIQRAARIELAQFNITYAEGYNELPVKLISAQLVNVNQTGKVAGTVANTSGYASGATFFTNVVLDRSKKSYTPDVNPFYSFSTNASDGTKVSLQLVFKVGDKENAIKTYTIKHQNEGELVKAGSLYRLTVNMLVTSGEVDASITCFTQDWVRDEVLVDMTESK